MATMLRITYYADGIRNGCATTLNDCCGNTYDDFVISADSWNRCNTAKDQEDLLLSIARRDYPYVDWKHAHYLEIHQV